MRRAHRPLIVPTLVLAEACYLIERQCGPRAEAAFVRGLRASPAITLAPVLPEDLDRIAEVVDRYADLPLGSVDASVIATAERLGVTTIATLDRRHFTVVRPRHTTAFTLLPD